MLSRADKETQKLLKMKKAKIKRFASSLTLNDMNAFQLLVFKAICDNYRGEDAYICGTTVCQKISVHPSTFKNIAQGLMQKGYLIGEQSFNSVKSDDLFFKVNPIILKENI